MLRLAGRASPTATTPSTNANGTANAASSSAIRCDARARTIAAGIVATPARPSTTATQARRLLLCVRATTCSWRNRAADDPGDGDQRQNVRQRLEQDGGIRPRRRLRHAERQRGREPEQKRCRECSERPPVAEDQRRETDEAAPRGHVLVERADIAEGQGGPA